MQRDDQELGPAGVLEPNVAATLANVLPTDPHECVVQLRRKRPAGPRSRGNRVHAPNDAGLDASAVLTQPFDVERQRLSRALSRVLEVLALRVQPRQIRGVHVVAACLLRLEDELDFASIRHALRIRDGGVVTSDPAVLGATEYGDGGNRTHVRGRVMMASTSVAGALVSSLASLAGWVAGDQPSGDFPGSAKAGLPG